jgi:hypothetical protein
MIFQRCDTERDSDRLATDIKRKFNIADLLSDPESRDRPKKESPGALALYGSRAILTLGLPRDAVEIVGFVGLVAATIWAWRMKKA